MHMGAIDTTARIQYRRHPITGELQYRHVWEDDNLGGFFSSAWSSIKGAVKTVAAPVISVVKTIEKEVIRPIIKPVAAITAGVFISPAAGAALYAALKAKDAGQAQQAAQQVADSAGAPVEIPARSDVADPAAYDKYMVNLEAENKAGRIANVRYWAKKLNELPLRPAGSIPPVTAPGQPAATVPAGGMTPGMTLPQPYTPYFPQSVPSSIQQPFIPGWPAPAPGLPPGWQRMPAPAAPAAAGFGNIPMPLLLAGGGALLLVMMMTQRR